MRTLVVVDMQNFFINDIIEMRDSDLQLPMVNEFRDALIHNTTTAVRCWRNNDWPIVFVQYKTRGGTHNAIRAPAKGYKKAYTLIKDNDNGGEELVGLVRREKLPRDAVFCGVNLDCCVHDTCHTYYSFESDKNVEILDECTRNVWDWELPKVSMKGWNKGIKLRSMKSLLGVNPKKLPHYAMWYRGTGRLKGALKAT